ncbi:MAG: pyruvate, phosphate dikinase [Rickettsiaceae bacterium]
MKGKNITKQMIYHFHKGSGQGDKSMVKILGNKGSGLAEMSNLKINVPPGFTLTTDLCKFYHENGDIPENIIKQIEDAVKEVELKSGKVFGSPNNPLLLAVRSGAPKSMPGMMDTILNLGLNEEIVNSLHKISGSKNFALDNYRRFLSTYATNILGLDEILFTNITDKYSGELNLEEIIEQFKQIIVDNTHMSISKSIPKSPYVQLIESIKAVCRSWNSRRAIAYRKLNNISEEIYTAINIQAMVFGNLNNDSATGVIFTRCPSTGNKELFGEFLLNAQGDDIVSGTRTPRSITTNSSNHNQSFANQLSKQLFVELSDTCSILESHYQSVQEIEFTVENSILYILQTRKAKRSIVASIKTAVDMAKEGIISKEEAVMRVNPNSINQILHASIDDAGCSKKHITSGLPASPGGAVGAAVFSCKSAKELSNNGNVILVRHITSPEDVEGMGLSSGILTAVGGMTSHAAVIARGMGVPCICGAKEIQINEDKKEMIVGNMIIKEGDLITIDGSTGKLFLGTMPLKQPKLIPEFYTILDWASEFSDMKVHVNAETKQDLSVALDFGADGIGLCRTEHMFFNIDKILCMQKMIIANDDAKLDALNKLEHIQKDDFMLLFKCIKDKSINIRLLDPPLHEFLPSTEKEKSALADYLNIDINLLDQNLESFHETNPMLGHRGCRLSVTFPEIYAMQIRAILSAAYDNYISSQIKPNIEIMIPFISEIKELQHVLLNIKNTIAECENKYRYKFGIIIGIMIELPRAALISDLLSKEVDFFSFGTNDLTQTVFGMSRDDISSFLPQYLEQNIFSHDPFVEIDRYGVGELIKLSMKLGKATNPNIKFGICGEHAGNQESIEFFDELGLDYISCSPYRIPIARLASAQACISKNKK